MFDDRDGYATYYTERLWNLIPSIYRANDSDDPDVAGPLRELVCRLGTQAAVVRRSIDRTGEDQSIESCDDWIIPYLGDLLATNLVSGLDARSQRLDVANTIYYRRRKGTVGLLEELSADITGWSARVVESFRRLARTRHNFDPEIGLDRDAAVISGLVGALSGTPAGGYADLRHVSSAAAAHTAFDEFSHTADFRRGRQASGWYNIPKLCVFLWRLRSYDCRATTPVQDAACPGQFTFDPTGREIPLFARDVRDKSQYGDAWVTPDEWMLPTRISTPLWNESRARLYPASFAVLGVSGLITDVVPDTDLRVVPERGRFQRLTSAPAGTVTRVTYHNGFSSEIGAGAYDRRVLGEPAPARPAPLAPDVTGGGTALQTALTALGDTGTITINDSLTYTAIPAVTDADDLLIRGENDERPVVRLPAASPAWTFRGTTAESELVIDGLLVSGGDVILRGTFANVHIHCSTFDPGEAANDSETTPLAVDGRPLAPTTIWIEGQVATLTIRRSITGPIRTRSGGAVEKIRIDDSIVQAVRTTDPTPTAIASADAELSLTRVTVLGRIAAHRISATESILAGLANADDAQAGCVRFSAYVTGSKLHQPYESVVIRENAALFVSRRFGQPEYAQLSPLADREIIAGEPGTSVRSGAQNGSEMGAFAREQNPVKERGLRIKLNEFMPVGMTPVLIYVT
jgi:hypothetical protein